MNILHFIAELKNRILNITFPFFQKLGIHILPVHFYSPVPDTRKIPERAWSLSSPGLSLVDKTDLSFLERMRDYRNEFEEILGGG